MKTPHCPHCFNSGGMSHEGDDFTLSLAEDCIHINRSWWCIYCDKPIWETYTIALSAVIAHQISTTSDETLEDFNRESYRNGATE